MMEVSTPAANMLCTPIRSAKALAFFRVLCVRCKQKYINRVLVGLGNCALSLPFLVFIQQGVQKRIPPPTERLDSHLDAADVEGTQPRHEVSRHEQAFQIQGNNLPKLTPHG